MTLPSDILEQDKQRVVASLVEQMHRYDITLPELEEALRHTPPPAPPGTFDARAAAIGLISLLGLVFVLTSMATYITMFWAQMSSLWRVIVTLGPGLALHFTALKWLREERHEKAVAPLLMAGYALELAGLYVALRESSPLAPDLRGGVLAILALMAAQEGFLFLRHRLPVLLAALGVSAYGFTYVLLDMLGGDENVAAAVLGLSLLCVGHGLRRTRYAALTPPGYALGAVALNIGLFEMVQGTPFELLLLASAGAGVYLSLRARARGLLFISLFTIFIYSSYFTASYFIRSVGWPFSLVALGVVFIGCALFGLRAHKRLKG